MRNKVALLIIISLTAILLCGCGKSSVNQTDAPMKGEYVAQINIRDYGMLQVRLFEKEAPASVENFIKLSKAGYYDGAEISMVVPGYLMRTEGNEIKEISDGNRNIPIETSDNLKPIRGAVCMDLSLDGINSDTAFFILLGEPEDIFNLDELLDYKETDLASYIKYGYGIELSDDELKLYRQYGGAPWLQGHHSVFGQVYLGLDEVQNKLNEAEVSKDGYYTPVENIIIDSIEIFSVAE